jgi:hypothetical protein
MQYAVIYHEKFVEELHRNLSFFLTLEDTDFATIRRAISVPRNTGEVIS